MTTVEKIASPESALENEVNAALSKFSAEEKALKTEVLKDKKDLKVWTKEEMEIYRASGELQKRIEGYVQVNGEKITIDKIEMDDASGLLKMKYKIKLGTEEKTVTTYLQIMGETNNSYLQFKNNPTTNTETTGYEFYDKKLVVESGYNGGTMYDVNIVKVASKGIDIRIVENTKKTEEKRVEKVKAFEMALSNKDAEFDDATLENTKITALKDTKLGKEVTKEDAGYSRAIFMKEGEKYKEIGKVYFNEKGEVDTTKTLKSQAFKVLGVEMKIAVDTDKKSFTIENIDALKTQIKAQRDILKSYIGNSEFGDNTIFTGFNRAGGKDWIQTKLLGLKLTDDMYTFKRGGEKNASTINFGFTEKNDLVLKDIAGKITDPITIEIEKANGKKETKAITQDATKKKLIIDESSKELVTNQEKPELEDAPALLAKEYLYNQNGDKIDYHNKQGTLLSSIPASKIEENKRKLGTLAEDVTTDNLYKYIKKTMMDKTMPSRLKNINILDQDISAAFAALRASRNKENLAAREVVKVLDNEKEGIYKYYRVDQKKDGDAFVFEDDKALYDEAETIMEEILENITTVEKIENAKLLYKDKKEKVEKPFTQFVGGSGLLPIDTKAKIAFLQNTEKTSLTRKFIRGSKTEDIQNFDITFDIKGTDISISENEHFINNQNYKTRLEDKDESLTLRFDDIAGKKKD